MFLKALWSQRRNSGTREEIEDSVKIENLSGPGKSGAGEACRAEEPGKSGGEAGRAGEPGKSGAGEAGCTGEPEKAASVGQRKGRDGDKKRMSDLDQAVDTFIQAILASETYRTYQAELAKVKQDPELKRQIDEFRKRNFELQLSPDADYEKLDRFEKEYESFREQPLVADFLAGELDLCRKMQEISMRVVEALNFE